MILWPNSWTPCMKQLLPMRKKCEQLDIRLMETEGKVSSLEVMVQEYDLIISKVTKGNKSFKPELDLIKNKLWSKNIKIVGSDANVCIKMNAKCIKDSSPLAFESGTLFPCQEI